MSDRNQVIEVYSASDREVTIVPPPPPPESWREWDPSEYRAFAAASAGGVRIEQTEVFKRAQREIDSLVVGGRPAWHGLGKTFERELMTAEEAITEGGLDWTVEKRSLSATASRDDLAPLDVTTHVATVRADRDAVLGIVGARYTPVQNREAFTFMDELVSSGDAKYHTAGSLYGGKAVFLTLKLDRDIRIGGEASENLDPFLMCCNYHDGLGSFGVYATALRVVCGNTQRLAVRGSELSWRYRHTSGVTKKVSAAREAFGMTWTYLDELERLGNDLIVQRMSRSEFHDRFVPALLPFPHPKCTDRQVTSTIAAREALTAVHDGAANLANIRGTRWGALQAVLEWEEHCSPVRGDGTTAASRRFERSVIIPSPLREQALEMLTV